MAYSEKLANRIRELLEPIEDSEEKKMFSGIAFMVDGKMCVTVRDNRIMCRIDSDIQEKLLKKPGCSAVIMKGSEYKGYVHVDEEVLKTKKDLKYWVDLALEFNPTAKSSKKGKG